VFDADKPATLTNALKETFQKTKYIHPEKAQTKNVKVQTDAF